MNFKNCSCLLMLAAVLLSACTKHDGTSTNPDVEYYTCTMHPSVHSHDPKAKCPICSMDLEPVMKKGAGGGAKSSGDAGGVKTFEGVAVSAQPSEFMVPVERQQQIGVTYAAATVAPLHQTIRSVGTVAPDRTRRWEFVARVEGYVQKLEVTSAGELVKKNQPLLSIYSPELLAAERDLVNLLDSRDRSPTTDGKAGTNRLLESSRRRLEQWNVTAEQIDDLEKSRKPEEFLTLRSPFDGVIEEVPVDQGRKVMPGDHLVNVSDLSLVWVWIEFYENELSMLEKGRKVSVTTQAYPGEKFEGTIALVNPFVSEMKRTTKVRLDIANPDLKLRPGMFVNAELALDHGEALTIPVTAVMPTGMRTLVFITKGGGMLEPRFIQLGGKYGDLYEVKDGLKEGERVVASANFLIDAESKVQGAVKSFEEPSAQGPKPAPLPKEAAPLFQPVVTAYVAVKKQLADDKLDGLAAQVIQLREMVEAVGKSDIKPAERADDYKKHLDGFVAMLKDFKTGSLEEARVSFGKVSAVLIAIITEFPPPLGKEIFVMNCSMWEKSPGDWIQVTDNIENPFMGRKMLGCGDVVKKIAAGK